MSSAFTFEEELELELELAQLAEQERKKRPATESAILWTPDPLNKPQQAAYDSKADVLAFGGSGGGGKGIALDTPLPTPSGFVLMGEVKRGDQLLDDWGSPCTVTAVSAIHHRPCFALEFDDGTQIVVDDEHRWLILDVEADLAGAVCTTLDVVDLLTKQPRVALPGGPLTQRRYIVSVRPVPSVPTRCISVDSPSRLYLVSRSMIPTHNSDLILGLAFTRHRVSKIFRREASQLSDLIARAREIAGELMNLKGTCRMPDGRRISLLGVKDEGDINKHKGRPADLFAFDEATEFSEKQIRFLLGWMRSTTPGQRCRAVLCFNPPTTPEGRWVLTYFGPWLNEKHPNPAQPGELRWYATIKGGEEIECENGEPFTHAGELLRPMSRTFIPSRLSDNSYLSNTNYWAVLQSLKEPLRSQLLYGDFQAGIEDDPWQLIPTEWIKLAQKRWLDLGGRAPGGSTLDAIGVDVSRGGRDKTSLARRYGRFYAELDRFQGEPTDNGQKVATLVTRKIYEYGPPKHQPDINIDATGVGSSPYDFLIASNLIVTAIYNGNSATEGASDRTGRLKFRNKRAEIYWKFMEALHPDYGDDLALPPDQQLLGDLAAVHWQLTPQGVLIEDKKEIEKRIGRSPDDGDAVVNAYVVPPPPPGRPAASGQRQASGFKMV